MKALDFKEEHGKCHFCQESTSLNIHQNCSSSRKRVFSGKLRKRRRVIPRYTEDVLTKLDSDNRVIEN